MTLILGGSGQLGTALCRLLPEAVAPSHAELDLADIDQIRDRIMALQPSGIVNCAAYTDVDGAEADEEAAMSVNGAAVGVLAAIAHDLGIPFVTFSTDYVFAGDAEEPYTEPSQPNPINAYGRSKLVGEQLALEYPGSMVIRTSWLVSTTHPNFVSAVVRQARQGAVRVVADQWGSPTLVSDLGPVVLEALARGVTGVLHLASSPITTRLGLARAALAANGLDPELAVGCMADEYPLGAARPRFSALASVRLGLLGINELPDWRAGMSALVG